MERPTLKEDSTLPWAQALDHIEWKTLEEPQFPDCAGNKACCLMLLTLGFSCLDGLYSWTVSPNKPLSLSYFYKIILPQQLGKKLRQMSILVCSVSCSVSLHCSCLSISGEKSNLLVFTTQMEKYLASVVSHYIVPVPSSLPLCFVASVCLWGSFRGITHGMKDAHTCDASLWDYKWLYIITGILKEGRHITKYIFERHCVC